LALSQSQKASLLTLGWKVNNTLLPEFWLQDTAKPGQQDPEFLVQVSASNLVYHTAIVAQSGSGKSFFLGRLIEELLLETHARCVVLDPNADFRRGSESVDETRWTAARFNIRTGSGFLPHEATREAFAKRWASISKRLLGGPDLSAQGAERLSVYWPTLSVEFLAEEVPPMLRSELYHCHEFVKAVSKLSEMRHLLSKSEHNEARYYAQLGKPYDVITRASGILNSLRGSLRDGRQIIESQFDPDILTRYGAMSADDDQGKSNVLEEQLDLLITRVLAPVEYISRDVERYYFGKAREYISQRIVRSSVDEPDKQLDPNTQLQVIDLPSFEDLKTRLLAVNSVLSTLWSRARREWEQAIVKPEASDTRVPTFIVVDEAHNLIPATPRGLAAEALRDQFRSIAAEGRKYGLFLILCTQRPDKLDELVLSECENHAIMKVGSRSVLDTTERLFGVEIPTDLANKCLNFGTGRVLLLGRWATNGPQLLYAAMRRTMEGGRNLRGEYWAVRDIALAQPAIQSRLAAP
jgi:hypothetical protein